MCLFKFKGGTCIVPDRTLTKYSCFVPFFQFYLLLFLPHDPQQKQGDALCSLYVSKKKGKDVIFLFLQKHGVTNISSKTNKEMEEDVWKHAQNAGDD